MIYTLPVAIVVPGKMAEYLANMQENVPFARKVGMKLVGSWHSYTGNMNANYNLYVYDDLASYQKSRAVRAKDPDFAKGTAKNAPLLMSQTIDFLEPNPWSPMK
jgi:hypothetical protein